jgi:hypothetical protein
MSILWYGCLSVCVCFQCKSFGDHVLKHLPLKRKHPHTPTQFLSYREYHLILEQPVLHTCQTIPAATVAMRTRIISLAKRNP